jgi:hypothetical protein
VVAAGYSAAFLFLAAIAAVGLGMFVALMPETGPNAGALKYFKEKAIGT